MKDILNKKIWIIVPIVFFFLFSCASTQKNKNESSDAYDKAISVYDKWLETFPRDYIAYMERGNVFMEKGQYDQAILDYNKSLEINPKGADAAYKNRGNAYYMKGQYDQAISDYSKSLETNPRDAWAYVNRGNAYYMKGQYDKAILDYNKALEINPRHASAYNRLAWLLATAKEPGIRNGEKAVEYALKACELSDWKYPICFDTLAVAYARVGDFNNAIKWQEKALESPEFAKDREAQQRLNLYRSHKVWPSD